MPFFSSRIEVDGVPIGVGGDAACAQPRFSPDGSLVAFLCDATGYLNLWVADGDGSNARVLVDEMYEHGEPTWYEGARSFAWSPDGRCIAFERNEHGFGRLCVIELASGAVRETSRGVHRALAWWESGIACVRSGARTPEQWVVIDPDTGTRTELFSADSPVSRDLLVEPDLIEWTSTDGAQIPGRVYRAASSNGGLLVWIHGGPTGQSRVDWNRRVVGALAAGWSVFVPDHRGTTGWGRGFMLGLQHRWGEVDVADTATGVAAVLARGDLDGSKVVVAGPSAGGFTVLHLLAEHPGRYAGGIVWYPVSDLVAAQATTIPFEAHYFDTLVAPGELEKRSPLTVAGKITDPLLMFHGADDPVVSMVQSRVFADRVPTAELVVFAGEGHGFKGASAREEEGRRVERFLANVLNR